MAGGSGRSSTSADLPVPPASHGAGAAEIMFKQK
jgi:hypothetical protein